jgi:hypothetical protein
LCLTQQYLHRGVCPAGCATLSVVPRQSLGTRICLGRFYLLYLPGALSHRFKNRIRPRRIRILQNLITKARNNENTKRKMPDLFVISSFRVFVMRIRMVFPFLQHHGRAINKCNGVFYAPDTLAFLPLFYGRFVDYFVKDLARNRDHFHRVMSNGLC